MTNDRSGKFLKFALLIPTLLAVIWSVAPSIRAIVGVITAPAIDAPITSANDELSIRRNLQKHFLKFDVYIPLEDIIFAKREQKSLDRTVFLMQKICGEGNMYVWVPLRTRTPIFGESVYDWCWKPTIEEV